MPLAAARWLASDPGAVDAGSELRGEAEVTMARPALPARIGTAGRAVVDATAPHPEEVGQPEVRPWVAPLVVAARLAGRDQAASALDEAADTGALGLGQRTYVRENKQGEAIGIAIDVVSVDRHVRDAGTNESIAHSPLENLAPPWLVRPA